MLFDKYSYIPDGLKVTVSGKAFLFFDSGSEYINITLIFSSENSLKDLSNSAINFGYEIFKTFLSIL
jgi:hypothetical protein